MSHLRLVFFQFDRTALEWAVWGGQLECARALLDAGQAADAYLLDCAAEIERHNVEALLLAYGARHSARPIPPARVSVCVDSLSQRARNRT